MRKIFAFIAAFIIITAWITVVVASGFGWNAFPVVWNFSNTAAFGESFGPISAVMAAIAAISAVAALRAQQKELRRLQAHETEEDKRNQKADFERIFFQILEYHSKIRNSIDIQGSGPRRTGQDAFRSILYYFENRKNKGFKKAWEDTYEFYGNDLGHYFRFLYHLILFLDSQKNIDRYFYARLARATLSQSELLCLAFNCAWGEGKSKFSPLVERYSLLHNLPQHEIDTYGLHSEFLSSAFQPDSEHGLSKNEE